MAAASFLVSACMGDGGGGEAESVASTAAEATSTDAGPETTTVARALPPYAFEAEPDGLRVVLTWGVPPGEVDRYVIFRDGNRIANLEAAETTFTDQGDVLPDRTYRYEIESWNDDGVSDRVSVRAVTPRLGLGAARLQGSFNVRGKTLSSSGLSRYDDPEFGWRFRPRCPEGACKVRWSDLHTKRIRTVLARKGSRYSGTYSGVFYITCGGAQTTATVTLTLRVTAAEAIGGQWRATRLRGTLEQSSPSQLGCVSSRATVAVRARLVN